MAIKRLVPDTPAAAAGRRLAATDGEILRLIEKTLLRGRGDLTPGDQGLLDAREADRVTLSAKP